MDPFLETKMENGALKTHLSQVIHKAKHAPPKMARLVFRAGVFLVVAKSEQKIMDKLILTLSPGDFVIGFRSDFWETVTNKAMKVLEEYTREQAAKNAKQ